MSTKERILTSTIMSLARNGYTGTSIRHVAEQSSIKPAVIYNYFPDKESLMRDARQHIINQLDNVRPKPEAYASARELLQAILHYQFENRELIVALLQYFIAKKDDFPGTTDGYVPIPAYRHMRRVITMGMKEKRYSSNDPDIDAKIMLHLVNGFLIEYYPHNMTRQEISHIVESMTEFIERSLSAGIKQVAR